jgi:hypothetical protein
MDNSNLNHLYEDTDTRVNTLVNQDMNVDAFNRIFNAIRKEFPEQKMRTEGYQKIIDYMIETYGIRLFWTTNEFLSGWDTKFEIVDEARYTFFLLKY